MSEDSDIQYATCKTCGKKIGKHTKPGMSGGWFHVNAQVGTTKPHTAATA